VERLGGDIVDVLTSDLDTWSALHIRWAGSEAEEHCQRRETIDDVGYDLPDGPIARRRWLRSRIFGSSPLFLRAFAYFAYRYILRFGFLDGREGLIFHFLQACWFRFYVDAKIWERAHTHE